MPPPSPYRVLGVPEGASPDEVRRAYRRKALRYHPDRNPGDPTSKESFLRVQRAFESVRTADGGVDADRVVAEMQRAAGEAERRRARAAPDGRAWQQVRVPLDRSRSESVRAHVGAPRAANGVAAGAVVGVALAVALALGVGASAVVSVVLGAALAAVVWAYAVRTAETAPWAVETHWQGLRDLRWGVTVGWAEIRDVRASAGAVDLALTPGGTQRAADLVPPAVFVEPGVYRLPVQDGAQLVPVVRAHLRGASG